VPEAVFIVLSFNSNWSTAKNVKALNTVNPGALVIADPKLLPVSTVVPLILYSFPAAKSQ